MSSMVTLYYLLVVADGRNEERVLVEASKRIRQVPAFAQPMSA